MAEFEKYSGTMPNWAYTQYIIVGPKPSLQQASQFMERFIGKWLDEPITALGVDPNADGIECRGWVDGVYPSEDCLEVYTKALGETTTQPLRSCASTLT